MSAPGPFDAAMVGAAGAAQVRAADPSSSAWVAANAGSGKTRLLTDRAARLLLGGAGPERVLCLTFTKAAAGEMANRLFARFADWAVAEDGPLARALGEVAPDFTADAAGLRDARRLFARALETPGGLKIQTIHAFCEQVLRRFPVEAGAPPGFRTLEEAEAADLFAAAQAAVLSGREGDCAAAAARVFDETSVDRAGVVLRRARGLTAAHVAAFRHAAGLLDEDGAEDLIAAAAGEFDRVTLTQAACLSEDLKPTGGAARTRDAARACLLALEKDDADAAWAAWSGALLRTENGAAKRRQDICAKTDAPAALIDGLVAEADRLADRAATIRAAARAEATEALRRVAAACEAAYRRRKVARAALDFQDLITATAALLNSEAGAWARWRLDQGIDHILVDEAQDNSPDQWAVVAGLAQEFFASPEGPARTVLAVGDAKQSIFGFQGAAPREFFKAGDDYAARARALGRGFVISPLEVSFRSAPEILTAVDAVCADEAVKGALGPGVDPARAPEVKFAPQSVRHHAARTARGRVEMWDVIPPPDVTEELPFHLPLDDPRRRPAASVLAERVAEDIRRRIAAHEIAPATGRPLQPGDILILVRRRGALYAALARALLKAGVPCAGRDRFTPSRSLGVQDVLAVLHVVAHEDDLALAALLRSPLADMSEEGLQALAFGRKGASLRDRLTAPPASLSGEDMAAAVRAAEILDIAEGLWREEGPYAVLAAILGSGRPSARARLVGRLGSEAEDALDAMLDAAAAHEAAGGGVLSFLHAFSNREADVKREFEDGRNEVRVMTVHGAKGLEAPVVYLPDTTTVPKTESGLVLDLGRGGRVWAGAKEVNDPLTAEALEKRKAAMLEEEARLLYVAMTRAQDRLVVAGAAAQGGSKPILVRKGSWREILERALAPLWEEEGAGLCAFGPDFAVGDSMHEIGLPHADAGDEDDGAAPPAFAPARPRFRLRPSAAGGKPATAKTPTGADERHHADVTRDDPDAARTRGTVIHALLERLADGPKEARAENAGAVFAALAPDMSDDAAAAWLAEATGVLDDARFAFLFAPGSLGEAEIVGRLKDGRTVAGRVDRLARHEGALWIVDFKTDRRPPPEGAAVHAEQLALYRAVLRFADPGTSVRAAVLWTVDARLEEVDAMVLDAAAPGGR